MASYTHRYFNWPEAILWPHQIPGFLDSNRFIVILSGMDDIINSRRIRKYLLGQGMKDAFVSKETSFNSTKLDSDIKSRGKMISKINGQPICQYSTEALQAFSRQELLHRPKGYHKGDGGIIFDPYATHGETFMPGNPYFATIKTWLEGNGIHLTNEA
ncbi:hypothetical protein O181_040882 [Austropuccinia psidii MF-1]|uniref:Uncharacterized protein n=1 Tax=Austropuccinia psidii MF-1 TaxID=1389203 RepID=A0A9Q3DJR2_9BASI|nr:hypothetical protein [Austropuccinia psidii MF-1]